MATRDRLVGPRGPLDTAGYLLRMYEFPNGDRSFRFFTAAAGLISIIARRSMVGHLPPLANPETFDLGVITMVARPRHPGARMLDYTLVRRHHGLGEEPLRLGAACLAAETVERLFAGEDPHPAVMGILGGLLDGLERGGAVPAPLARGMLALFEAAGFSLDVKGCRACGRPPKGPARFQVASGGFVHMGCADRGMEGMPVSPGTLLFLDRVRQEPPARLSCDRRIADESLDLFGAHLTYITQERTPSLAFLHKMREGG